MSQGCGFSATKINRLLEIIKDILHIGPND